MPMMFCTVLVYRFVVVATVSVASSTHTSEPVCAVVLFSANIVLCIGKFVEGSRVNPAEFQGNGWATYVMVAVLGNSI